MVVKMLLFLSKLIWFVLFCFSLWTINSSLMKGCRNLFSSNGIPLKLDIQLGRVEGKVAVHIHNFPGGREVAPIPLKCCSQLNENPSCSGSCPKTRSEACLVPLHCVMVAPVLTPSQRPGSKGSYNRTSSLTASSA